MGEDWLEDCSPMLVDYKLKTMKFNYEGKMIELQGVRDDVSSCSTISATKLKGLIKHGAVSHCVQMVLPSQQSSSQTQSSEQEVVPSEVAEILQ